MLCKSTRSTSNLDFDWQMFKCQWSILENLTRWAVFHEVKHWKGVIVLIPIYSRNMEGVETNVCLLKIMSNKRKSIQIISHNLYKYPWADCIIYLRALYTLCENRHLWKPPKNLKHLAIQPLSQVPGLDCSIPLKYSASIFKSQLELGLKIQCHKPVRSNPAMTSMTPKTLSIAMVILGLVSSWGISRSKDPIMKHIIEPTNSIITPISKETWIFVRYLRLLSLLYKVWLKILSKTYKGKNVNIFPEDRHCTLAKKSKFLYPKKLKEKWNRKWIHRHSFKMPRRKKVYEHEH